MLRRARRLPDMHGARAIRTVIGEYNTKITDHESAVGNARSGRTSMHNCRTRPCGKDGCERHAVSPSAPGLVFHRGSDFDLADTRLDFVAGDLKEAGTEFNCPPDAEDLISILDHARPLDERRRGTQTSGS